MRKPAMFLSAFLLLFSIMQVIQPLNVMAMSVNKKIIVIDAGHGGWDPGKVGANDVLEKDINLAIAEDLQVLLETSGAVVFMTRAADVALADRKNADLSARSTMPSEMQAHILVSIHQNSYPQKDVKGAQTFYYTDSEKGKRLASAIQDRIRGFLDGENRREAKVDNNYYLLRKSEIPAVIVECGFLSSPEETLMLAREDYQEKMAWAIYMGILDYFNEADASE